MNLFFGENVPEKADNARANANANASLSVCQCMAANE